MKAASGKRQKRRTDRVGEADPSARVFPPRPSVKSFYGPGIPGVNAESLPGKLVVVEGADGSGRSTQIRHLVGWLESSGHATVSVGLKRSSLISAELDEAQRVKLLTPRTMSLFYATDFADQLENIIIPALRSGFIVLSDRYIYTLIARGLVRGVNEAWLRDLYGIALIPDAVFYLSVSPEELIQRNFAKDFALDYWESGMDLGLSRDMFDSFLRYQGMIQEQFQRLQKVYGLTILDGNRSIEVIRKSLQKKIAAVLAGRNQRRLRKP